MTRHILCFLSAATMLTACAETEDSMVQNTANIAGTPASSCVQIAVADTGYDAGEVQVSATGNGTYDVAVVGARFFCTTDADGKVTSFVPV